MASVLANVIGKRILRENVKNKFGKEDPYFEQVPATRLDGRPTGKFKKRKKALPPGISEHDGQVLTKVKRRAYRLDMSLFNFMGIRFGWSSVIGLIPAAGDALDAFMALMVYRTCCQVEGGLPTSVRLQMLINIVLDFAVGLVPFLGDLVDAVFRANTRNAALLEEHLRQKGKTELRKSGLPVPAVDPSSAQEYDRIQREDPPEYRSNPPSRRESPARYDDRHHHEPRAPAAAAVRDGRGYLGRNTAPPHDVEMGEVDLGQHHQGSSSHGGKKKSKWHGLL
ncbi:hypothetical protein TRIATDRAFT_217932 [Trichoderma atroviride IMI 206040]|uniref:PH domain-containing protein n=1 Tax=Hypocrea atroviridis (strain ATCC 20476 / IMI 206040) TaxID=452589 RepID=G9NQH7_HYPAI|nr:uncharacterized protein TRIATDRAFT_217932 [Trichoderma atroviride IMI 206040]EHK47317.1 hypothetical protein TRIATDRAFT_217932 [Trichoderma atroviride IMI 206040]